MIKKTIGAFIIRNWKIKSVPAEQIKGTVLIAAPHTSNWDFLYAHAVFWKLGLDVKFIIKDSHTKNFFYGWLVKWMGGIGINRSQSNDMINYCSELIKNNPKIVMVIPAEGTRSKGVKWKLGFYYIALKANVPISLGYLDYTKKEGGITKIVYPNKKEKTELFKEIELYYKDFKGKHPDNFTPNIEEKS